MITLKYLFFLIIGYLLGVWTNRILFKHSFKIYTDEVNKQYIKKLKEIQEKKEN